MGKSNPLTGTRSTDLFLLQYIFKHREREIPVCAKLHRNEPGEKCSEMLKVASLGSEILGSFHSLSPYNFLFCLFFATSMYCFYIWGRVEIFFKAAIFIFRNVQFTLYLGQIMASLEPQGAGKTSPIFAFCILQQRHGRTFILATDEWSFGGRGGSVRCSPIKEARG